MRAKVKTTWDGTYYAQHTGAVPMQGPIQVPLYDNPLSKCAETNDPRISTLEAGKSGFLLNMTITPAF